MLRALYEWTMDKAAHRHAPAWLAFFCFVESSFFPIPPHPLLGLMCLAMPGKALRYGLIATAASVLGGLFGYAIGYFLYESIGSWLIATLGLTEAFPQAACYLREYDFEVILVAGATPIPFKLLTITAGFIEMNIATFTLAAIAGRGLIFLTVGILFRIFGRPIKKFIDEYLPWVTTAFVALVVAGILALTLMGGSDEEDPSDRCAQVTSLDQL